MHFLQVSTQTDCLRTSTGDGQLDVNMSTVEDGVRAMEGSHAVEGSRKRKPAEKGSDQPQAKRAKRAECSSTAFRLHEGSSRPQHTSVSGILACMGKQALSCCFVSSVGCRGITEMKCSAASQHLVVDLACCSHMEQCWQGHCVLTCPVCWNSLHTCQGGFCRLQMSGSSACRVSWQHIIVQYRNVTCLSCR